MYVVTQWLVKHSKICATAAQNTLQKGVLKPLLFLQCHCNLCGVMLHPNFSKYMSFQEINSVSSKTKQGEKNIFQILFEKDVTAIQVSKK